MERHKFFCVLGSAEEGNCGEQGHLKNLHFYVDQGVKKSHLSGEIT